LFILPIASLVVLLDIKLLKISSNSTCESMLLTPPNLTSCSASENPLKFLPIIIGIPNTAA
tara:strand:- start:1401 stop:1583 length:183 start_codon:yes stop_codon:yes gene_type:complete